MEILRPKITSIFGAGASVFVFDKVSWALWHILVHGLNMLSSVFYDDYPCFGVEPLTQITAQTLDKFSTFWAGATPLREGRQQALDRSCKLWGFNTISRISSLDALSFRTSLDEMNAFCNWWLI